MNQARSFPNCSPATGVSSAHQNAFESGQPGLGRTWWRGPPGMAREHVALKEEEFKGSYNLWELWACCAQHIKTSACKSQLWTTTGSQTDPACPCKGNYKPRQASQHLHGWKLPNLPSMSPRFMHQARATGLLSLPSRRAEEDMLMKCCARTAHHSTKKKGRTIPPRGRSFSHLILICPVEEKSLGVCSEDNRSHNSGVLAEKGQTKKPCQHTEHIMHKLLCHPC